MRRAVILLVLTLFLVTVVNSVPVAVSDDRLLDDLDVARRLDEPVSLSWSGVPLGEGLARLVGFQNLALLLDRRVDPGQNLDHSANEQPLGEAIDGVAQQFGLDRSTIGELIYVGPAATARRLATLAALRRRDAGDLQSSQRRRLLEVASWHWDDFATPRELIEELGSEVGWTIDGLDRVPHDLWAAASLPPLPWTDRLSLVAAQFDLTFELDEAARTVTLVAAPAEPRIEKKYRGGSSAERQADALRQLLPEAEVDLAGDSIVVSGRFEDHAKIRQAQRGRTPSSRPTSPEQEVHDLSVENAPVGAILKAIEKRLGLEMRFAEDAIREAGISLEMLVTVKVQHAATDELLSAVLEPAGLDYRRTDNAVEVFPADPQGSVRADQ